MFNFLARNGPSGSVWVLDQDVFVDFKGCESVGIGVIEFSAFLATGSHTAFQLLWFSLPFVGERAVVRRKRIGQLNTLSAGDGPPPQRGAFRNSIRALAILSGSTLPSVLETQTSFLICFISASARPLDFG
jgi:hypothetical protein